ncbi:MAG: hypothetical protein LBK91_01270 [Synergistaceae bacterium]|nr:hypothetical protein [Synergistaceae bacterium]
MTDKGNVSIGAEQPEERFRVVGKDGETSEENDDVPLNLSTPHIVENCENEEKLWKRREYHQKYQRERRH